MRGVCLCVCAYLFCISVVLYFLLIFFIFLNITGNNDSFIVDKAIVYTRSKRFGDVKSYYM